MKRIAVIEICEECHKRPYCVLRKFDDCPHLDSLEAHDEIVRAAAIDELVYALTEDIHSATGDMWIKSVAKRLKEGK